VIHDVALQNLPVLFAIDRAGLVGPDGPTHAGSFDLSYLRCIPNMVIMAPADENECRQMLYTGFRHPGLPRSATLVMDPAAPLESAMTELPIGKARILREGTGFALLAFGSMVEMAKATAARMNATLIDMRFVKPLDEEMIVNVAHRHDFLVTIEENALAGGAGSGVNESLAAAGIAMPVLNIGLYDSFIEHGSQGKSVCAARSGYWESRVKLRISCLLSSGACSGRCE
jgi:1-deoxy-D-xylulose-5-phosphate synthase